MREKLRVEYSAKTPQTAYHPDAEQSARIAALRVRCRAEPGPVLVEANALAQLAAQKSDRRLAAWAELVRSVCLNNTGGFSEAMAAGRKALLHFSALREKRGEAFTLRAIGVSYHRLGDPHKALAWYRRALGAGESP